ncbi:hypothetical protein HY004_03030 [Candidatus Saccharibacteria bacterium]|nr:hypothetical protein [Candidatus Saccharibacteria bacterium]
MIYILGRQPAIGLAELESLYDASSLRPVGDYAAVVERDTEVNFGRIGGAIKVGKVLATIDSTDLNVIKKQLESIITTHLTSLPEGKFKLGISCYGLNASPARINALGLGLKKAIKASGRSVRLIPNPETALNSAQVLNNKLTSELGCELLLIRDGVNTIVAQTTAVQDIDAYTLRDRGRPKRDARVGMLPPKLAQTIVNIAAANTPPDYGAEVFDPFCGTGVILQEAALMGYDITGSDLEQRMVDYTDANLLWLLTLKENRVTPLSPDKRYYRLEVGDATTHKWANPGGIVASEVYLGRPFTSVPDNEILQKTINDCDTILKKFLANLHDQIQPGTRLCLAVPSWFVANKINHLRTLDQLPHLGYNRISFVHSNDKDLVYHREGQIVGRELLVLTRK